MKNENILGTLPIPKLLIKFGIPSVVSFLVNSIYNIVDQIFIGQKVGALGNAATTVSFPFVTLTLALALMVSVGTAANISLNLGRIQQERAERTLGNGITLAIILGLSLSIAGEAFMTPLLNLFGATENVFPYAYEYSRILLVGTPFVTVSIVLSDILRADGSPRYTMIVNLCCGVLNVILDAVFMYVFDWGVAGAAWATVISQFIALFLSVIRLPRLKTLKFSAKNMRLSLLAVKHIALIGVSSFITQVAGFFVQIVVNKTVVKYGAESIYGADIPLACFGIVTKVLQIMFSIILGICNATQPIFGYNFGARKYERVKQLVFVAGAVSLAFGVLGMIVFQVFPQQIINVFGQESALYNEFAVLCMRSMTMLIFLIFLQVLSSVYYQATGKPAAAIILSLSRQVLFLIPAIVILPVFFGIQGVMYAYPVSDLLSTIVGAIMIASAIKTLNTLIAEQKALTGEQII